MSEHFALFEDICSPGHKTWENGCFMDRAFRLLPSIVYIFNQDTQSNEFSNRSIGEVMGYSPEELKAFGANLMATLCHPEDLPGVFQHFKRIGRLADGDVVSIEYRVRHKAGHWIWFLSMDTVFDRHSDGRVRRHLGAATEITRLKQAEEQAVASSQSAAVANKDLRDFAYSISHDMKSPLNTLCLLLSEFEACHGSGLHPDAKQLLEKAHRTSQNMQRRIDRVLEYTRIIERTPECDSVPLDMVVGEILSAMDADHVAASATIECGPLPTVSGCQDELKVMFQNLIANALKFHAPDTASKITVFDKSNPGEATARIQVTDNGIGIAPENHASIFELFKRLNPERHYPGSGLGLAICRRIALRHGGDITVKSEPGKGATFTVHLPRQNQTKDCAS